MTHPTRRSLRRSTARAVTGTVVSSLALGGAVALTAGPAQAATAPTLAWKVSERFDGHLGTHTLDGGASESDEGVVTFPNGEGSYDPADGSASITYDGSVKGAFVFMGTEYYQVTIADPAVEIDDAGNGTITALVSASNAESAQAPADSTDPARVVVTTFDAEPGDWTAGELGSLTATPDWEGVLPAGSQEAQELGMAEDQPVDGKSFAPTFLGQITSGVRAHFYASGSSSDDVKPPSVFTAQAAAQQAAPTPTVDVAVDAASYKRGLELDVTGEDFTGQTQPGDDGVYVGLAESGGLPDVSSPTGQDAFAAAAWVPASQMTDGTIDVDLDAPTEKLERGTDYSVYTWQAHGHSNTSQDTETEIVVPWNKLRAPATTTAVVSKKPKPNRTGRLRVTVDGAKGSGATTGQVEVTLAKKGRVRKTVAPKNLKPRGVTITLPKLGKGAWKATASYGGSDTHRASKDSVSFRVRR